MLFFFAGLLRKKLHVKCQHLLADVEIFFATSQLSVNIITLLDSLVVRSKFSGDKIVMIRNK